MSENLYTVPYCHENPRGRWWRSNSNEADHSNESDSMVTGSIERESALCDRLEMRQMNAALDLSAGEAMLVTTSATM